MPIIEGKGISVSENFHFESLLNFISIVGFRHVLHDKSELWGILESWNSN